MEAQQPQQDRPCETMEKLLPGRDFSSAPPLMYEPVQQSSSSSSAPRSRVPQRSSLRTFTLGIFVGVSICFLVLLTTNEDFRAQAQISSFCSDTKQQQQLVVDSEATVATAVIASGTTKEEETSSVMDDESNEEDEKEEDEEEEEEVAEEKDRRSLSLESFEFVVTETVKNCEISNKNWDDYSHLQLNALRRYLALYQNECYQKYKPVFVHRYKEFRYAKTAGGQSRQQLYLHVPKSGGTSVCEMAKASNDVVVDDHHNCWIPEFYPIWSFGQFDLVEPADNCAELSAKHENHTFMANEQFLRHPLCEEWLYSISVRPPPARAISNLRHLVDFKDRMDPRAFERRLNLIQSNFMTWMLVAGLQKHATIFQVPPRELKTEYHQTLQHALTTVNQFDYLVDLNDERTLPDNENYQCKHLVVQEMALLKRDETIPVSNVIKDPKAKKSYQPGVYAQINTMDTAIYNHVQELIRVDCEFFAATI